MFRRSGPAAADDFDEVAHAVLTALQRPDQSQPGRMAEGLEYGIGTARCGLGRANHARDNISSFGEMMSGLAEGWPTFITSK